MADSSGSFQLSYQIPVISRIVFWNAFVLRIKPVKIALGFRRMELKIVLIVKDSADIRELLSLLRQEGFETLTAGDCTSGYVQLLQHASDAVITDLMLPDFSGWTSSAGAHRRQIRGATHVWLHSAGQM